MRVNVHIDRIVVDGASLTRRQRDRLAQNLGDEIGRQLRRRMAGRPVAAAGGGGGGPGGSLAATIALDVVAAVPVGVFAGRRPVPSDLAATQPVAR
jgi:hypothetical protein